MGSVAKSPRLDRSVDRKFLSWAIITEIIRCISTRQWEDLRTTFLIRSFAFLPSPSHSQMYRSIAYITLMPDCSTAPLANYHSRKNTGAASVIPASYNSSQKTMMHITTRKMQWKSIRKRNTGNEGHESWDLDQLSNHALTMLYHFVKYYQEGFS